MKQVLILKYDLMESYPNVEVELHKAEDEKEANEIVEASYNEMKDLCTKTFCGEDEDKNNDDCCFSAIEEDVGAIVCDVEVEPDLFFAAKIIDPNEMEDPVILYNDPKNVAIDEIGLSIEEKEEDE